MSTFATKLIILALALQSIAATCGDGQADKMCRGCADVNTCSLCTYGFVNSTGTCQRSTSISHCLSYASNGICSVCDYGYYTTNSGTQCTSIPLNNCDRLVNDTSSTVACLYCKNSVLVDTNGTCNGVACATANCKYCTRTNGVETCDRCNNDYVNLISSSGTNSCVNENSNTDDCYYASVNATNADSAANYCILCDVDHYISNGTCKQSGISNSNNDNNSSAARLSLFLVGLLMALFA